MGERGMDIVATSIRPTMQSHGCDEQDHCQQVIRYAMAPDAVLEATSLAADLDKLGCWWQYHAKTQRVHVRLYGAGEPDPSIQVLAPRSPWPLGAAVVGMAVLVAYFHAPLLAYARHAVADDDE